jgi:hypothetical protein
MHESDEIISEKLGEHHGFFRDSYVVQVNNKTDISNEVSNVYQSKKYQKVSSFVLIERIANTFFQRHGYSEQ